MTAASIAQALDATLTGAPDFDVRGLASPARAGPHDLVVMFSVPVASASQALVVRRGEACPPVAVRFEVDQPRVAFARATALFCGTPAPRQGIHPTAVVDADATIAPTAWIGPHCVVEAGAHIGAGAQLLGRCHAGAGVQVGAGCVCHPGVVLYPGVVLGQRVVLHANATIGADGFGFATESPDFPKVYSLGGVVIDDDVEIGATTTVDAGTLEPTTIGAGSKLDDHVHIGHNCRIGTHCLIAGMSGLAGGVVLGDRVRLGGRVTVCDHVTVGRGAAVMMASTVTKDVPAGQTVLGFPAREHRREKRRLAALNRLAACSRKIVQDVEHTHEQSMR